MPNIKETICQRIGWEVHLKPFLYKKLPSNVSWSVTLGSLCALLFALMAASGMFHHRGYTIAGGTSEIQHNIIARQVLGL